jgi:hypothetical protein
VHTIAQDGCLGPVAQLPDMLNGLALPPSEVQSPLVKSSQAFCWKEPTNVMATSSVASTTVQPAERLTGWLPDGMAGVEFGLRNALLPPQPAAPSIKAIAATAGMIFFIIPPVNP